MSASYSLSNDSWSAIFARFGVSYVNVIELERWIVSYRIRIYVDIVEDWTYCSLLYVPCVVSV